MFFLCRGLVFSGEPAVRQRREAGGDAAADVAKQLGRARVNNLRNARLRVPSHASDSVPAQGDDNR